MEKHGPAEPGSPAQPRKEPHRKRAHSNKAQLLPELQQLLPGKSEGHLKISLFTTAGFEATEKDVKSQGETPKFSSFQEPTEGSSHMKCHPIPLGSIAFCSS